MVVAEDVPVDEIMEESIQITNVTEDNTEEVNGAGSDIVEVALETNDIIPPSNTENLQIHPTSQENTKSVSHAVLTQQFTADVESSDINNSSQAMDLSTSSHSRSPITEGKS